MACEEIDVMRRQVCDRLRGSVNSWQWELQSQWGDPRVYAMQQAEMARRDTAVAYDLSRRNSQQFAQTYTDKTTGIKDTHAKRISAAIKSAKRRGPKGSGKPPAPEADPLQTAPPPDAPARAPPPTPPPSAR